MKFKPGANLDGPVHNNKKKNHRNPSTVLSRGKVIDYRVGRAEVDKSKKEKRRKKAEKRR